MFMFLKQTNWFSAIMSLGEEESSTTEKMNKSCEGFSCVYTDTMLRLYAGERGVIPAVVFSQEQDVEIKI